MKVLGRTFTVSNRNMTASDRTKTVSNRITTVSNRSRTDFDRTTTVSNRTMTVSNRTTTVSNRSMRVSNRNTTDSNRIVPVSDRSKTVSNRNRTVFFVYLKKMDKNEDFTIHNTLMFYRSSRSPNGRFDIRCICGSDDPLLQNYYKTIH